MGLHELNIGSIQVFLIAWNDYILDYLYYNQIKGGSFLKAMTI